MGRAMAGARLTARRAGSGSSSRVDRKRNGVDGFLPGARSDLTELQARTATFKSGIMDGVTWEL
jgi:hypothetical protein